MSVPTCRDIVRIVQTVYEGSDNRCIHSGAIELLDRIRIIWDHSRQSPEARFCSSATNLCKLGRAGGCYTRIHEHGLDATVLSYIAVSYRCIFLYTGNEWCGSGDKASSGVS